MTKILVTGVTGNVGREVVPALLQKGLTVKAAARDVNRVNEVAENDNWSGDFEAVSFDYGDDESMSNALNGVDRVFLVTPTIGAVVQMVEAFLEVAKACDVKHIVRLSGMRNIKEASATHADCEQRIAASGIAFTHLRPNFFMQNFNTFYADGIKNRDSIALPAGEEPVSFIDVRDIADVAVVAFTQAAHIGKTYVLTGGQAITHDVVASALSDALGRKIAYINMPDEQFRQVLKQAGRPDAVAESIINLYAPVKQMLAAPITSDVETITGNAPRTIVEYTHDYRAAWMR